MSLRIIRRVQYRGNMLPPIMLVECDECGDVYQRAGWPWRLEHRVQSCSDCQHKRMRELLSGKPKPQKCRVCGEAGHNARWHAPPAYYSRPGRCSQCGELGHNVKTCSRRFQCLTTEP
jgi:hypothetical protein